MAKAEILTGLDIGSNQVCCVIGRRPEGSAVLEILGGAKLPCRGVKGGVVINLSETSYSVQKVIEQAEENFRIAEERFKERVSTSTEVLDAQTLLTKAKSDYTNALGDYNINYAKLQSFLTLFAFI